MTDLLLQHKSIRKFKSDAIDESIMERILHAACRASNTGNMQIYSIIVTTNEQIKENLCKEAHFNQAMVKDAPVVLTFCADLNRFSKWCILREAEPGFDNFLSLYTATIDVTIAAQNACIQAESEGLGICYLGTTNYNTGKVISILDLPEHVLPVTTVVLGYPNENLPQSERLPLEAIVHKEKYNDYSDEDIDRLFKEKENTLENLKYVELNRTKTLAHVFTEKRYTKINNTVFSQSLLRTLKKQGFMNND